MLPVGQSDVMREASVKIFCGKCDDIYYPRSSRHKSMFLTFPVYFSCAQFVSALQKAGERERERERERVAFVELSPYAKGPDIIS